MNDNPGWSAIRQALLSCTSTSPPHNNDHLLPDFSALLARH
jgi:hypothetical protein